MQQQQKILAGQAAIALAKQGKDAWNQWSAKHPDWHVDFAECDLSDCRSFESFIFSAKGNVSFILADFGEGAVSFFGANFGDGHVDFDNANFGKGDVSFFGANFGKGDVSFLGAYFGEGHVDFFGANFGEGGVSFSRTEFGKGDVDFDSANFGDGDVEFSWAKFGEGRVDFDSANFGDGDVEFIGANFGEGDVDFTGAKFGEGRVDFVGANFGDGNVGFDSADFGDGRVDFSGAKFGDGAVRFEKANFGEGDVSFVNACFGKGDVDFSKCLFQARLFFSGLKLIDPCSFRFVLFKNVCDFSKTKFDVLPDFRDASFAQNFTLSDVQISEFPSSDQAIAKQQAPKYRALKIIADKSGNKDLFLDFAAKELQAKRYLSKNIVYKALNFLYEHVSDYGRSVGKPVACLVALTLCMACLYGYFSKLDGSAEKWLAYSLAHTFPLFVSKPVLIATTNAMFAQTTPVFVILLNVLHGIASASLFFLMGLGLKNHFVAK